VIKMFRKIIIVLWSVIIMTATTTGSANAADPENTLYLDLESGRVTIETFPEIAPQHVERIKKLARESFYDGFIWHRVIDGFMAQTGDPTGTGVGGSEYPDLPAEFSDYNYDRGTIGMARTADPNSANSQFFDPNSANSQFFICFDDCSFLNGQYTVWGKVTDGMELVDGIAKGEPPKNPDVIVKLSVAADAVGAEEPAAGIQAPEEAKSSDSSEEAAE
jgi:peptidylprolyl isomerase